ncbi:MAG TPA: heme-dependent oxidative N-demethylase subunit alpha family protein [Trebonia sp.]|nr:heme-dependent oxidative N-demethylase subunit alpha family protein [Trebonia sp.]
MLRFFLTVVYTRKWSAPKETPLDRRDLGQPPGQAGARRTGPLALDERAPLACPGPAARGANADGVFARAEAFLLRLQPGQAYRRLNWAFHPLRVLDHSRDDAAAWMPEAGAFLATATDEDIAAQVYLRVELQHLIRLETSGAVLFLIDTRFLSLADLASVRAWSARVVAVLRDLPGDIAACKGLTALRPRIIGCLTAGEP